MEGKLQQTHTINPFYTDLYQLTTSYSYFLCGKHNEKATFECFFRKHPFKGEYTILGGVKETLAFIQSFQLTEEHIAYLRERFPHMKKEFFDWLLQLKTDSLHIESFKEGEIVFASEPIMTLTGPLALCQLLETPILNLIGFATLVATNASRMATAANGKDCVEFGIRRAQGPDGGLTASEYAYLGGFVGTSNVECGRLHKIPTVGTMSHAYITSFVTIDDAEQFELNGIKIKEATLKWRAKLGLQKAHEGELAAFMMYARAFPHGVVTLIDTFSTLDSGLLNTISLCAALAEAGIKEFGCRLDSGDLKDYAKKCKAIWKKIFPFEIPLKILASNDLNEESILEMEKEGCEIDTYAIGTNIATCQKQPALGLVYKLVEYKDRLTMKFSEEKEKITLPGRKNVWRVWTSAEQASFDLVTLNSQALKAGDSITVVATANPMARYDTKIRKLELLNPEIYKNGKALGEIFNIHAAKKYSQERRSCLKKGIFKLDKPEKHKVFVSLEFYKLFEQTIEKNIVLRDLE